SWDRRPISSPGERPGRGRNASVIGEVSRMRAFFRYGQCAFSAAFILSMWTLSALAQTAPPAAPPAAPPKIDTGDTAWMLTSTALVLMMTIPGLALFYGGMVRKMN